MFNLTNLNTLFLYNNNLTSIPPELGNLSILEYLNLTSNNLTELPPEIGSLDSLKYLMLDSNKLASVPPEIGNLTNLQIIFNLSNNKLTSIPSGLGNFTSLEHLDLSFNSLTGIPAEIGNCKALDYLYLNNNNLSNLPDSLVKLDLRFKLDCGYNNLDTTHLSDTVIAWLDEYDPDWRNTQIVPVIYNPQSYSKGLLLNINKSIILFNLPASGKVKLQLYNIRGRLLETLLGSSMQTGTYRLKWDSSRYGSGIYFLKLNAYGSSLSRKVTLVR